MLTREAMSDEELIIDYRDEARLGVFQTAMLLLVASWLGSASIISFLLITLPPVSQVRAIFWCLFAVSCLASIGYSFIAFRRVSRVQIRFNRTYLKVFEGGVLRQEVVWLDVRKVRIAGDAVITSSGSSVLVPHSVMNSQRHECRILRRHLRSLIPPRSAQSSGRMMTVGFVLFSIGLAVFREFQSSAGARVAEVSFRSVNWIPLALVALGALLSIGGMIAFQAGLERWIKAPRAHPFKFLSEGIRCGNRLVRWADIRTIERFGSEAQVVRLRLSAGRDVSINCLRYLDGEDLSRALSSALVAHVKDVDPLTMARPQQDLGIRAQRTDWTLLVMLVVLALGGFFLSSAALANYIHFGDRLSRTFTIVMGAVCLVTILPVIPQLARQIDLDDHVLSSRDLVGKLTQIDLNNVDAVTIRHHRPSQDAFDVMIIRSGRDVIVLNSDMVRYCELRDSILGSVLASQVRQS